MQRAGKFMDRTGPSLDFFGQYGPVQTAHLKSWIGLSIFILSAH